MKKSFISLAFSLMLIFSMKADFKPRVTVINYDVPVGAVKINGFGGMAISQELYHFMQELLPQGSTILEFGSGFGTGQLAKHFIMYSVEHNHQFVNRHSSNYIHAPIVNNWYNLDILKSKLPPSYDAILIDGPPRCIGRRGFLENIEMFDVSVPLIFDDVHIDIEWQIMFDTAKQLKRNCIVYVCQEKKWGVIFP
ncbi:MAG: hypothetical protein WD055_02610 [Candidatus Dependentiae bacterium]